MRSYTVQQVVKLEDRFGKQLVRDEKRRENDDDMIFPALLCFAIGGSGITTALASGQLSAVPLVLSGACLTYGAAKVISILNNVGKSKRILKKLDKIYESLSAEVKKDIEEELKNRRK